MIDQVETTKRISGLSTDGVRVTYQTDTGVVGNVFLPTTDYNSPTGPQQVTELINKAVNTHSQVRALTSETMTPPPES